MVKALQKNGVLTSSSSSSSSSSYDNDYQQQPSFSSSPGKINPAILFIVIIIAVILFISGFLHLLVRFLKKRQRASTGSETPGSNGNTSAFQRQLQQLFHLHDSGLDQASIEALPVFEYKEIIMWSKEEPFDCAVCLCEFSEQDKLRLLPLCSHAFHIDCIDTWMFSNSTCPLCRGSLYTPGVTFENPVFHFEEPREEGYDPLDNPASGVVSEGCEIRKRVLSVRLGKFRSINVGTSEEEEEEQRIGIETSITSGLDSRRCYSMGSYQYVVSDSDLQVVALRPNRQVMGIVKGWPGPSGNSLVDGNSEGKKIINIGSKGESFSQSKIWQWPRKGKFPSSSEEPHWTPTTDLKLCERH